jgi:RNA recognition motif-containing protein
VPKNRDRPTGDAVKPTRTLFVINFDPLRTKIRDIEDHFEPYGKISNIRIRKNFAFVRYETLEEASAAVKKTDKRYAFVSYYLVIGRPLVYIGLHNLYYNWLLHMAV